MAKPESESTEEPDAARTGGRRKGRPTPSRRQAEAERRRRLQLSPKERKKLAREEDRRRRMEAWEARDQTPEKELLRDVVDARWNLGEFLLPVLMVNLALTVGLPTATNWVAIFMYAYIVVTVLDCIWAWRRYRRLLMEQRPRTELKGQGLRMYMVNRIISIRPMRTPKPRVKRGEKVA